MGILMKIGSQFGIHFEDYPIILKKIPLILALGQQQSVLESCVCKHRGQRCRNVWVTIIFCQTRLAEKYAVLILLKQSI